MSTVCKRVRLTGTVEIALRAEQAFILFTPSGERTWAHGWNPSFPSPSEDETEPGTVFCTDHGGRESIWTVVRRELGRSIGYAVAIPEERCGLVTVTCEPSASGTKATVSYDLTALSSRANSELDRFAADYPSFLSHWEQSIAQALRANAASASQ
jgi:hypothetical protein